MWKRTTKVRTNNLVQLRDLRQESTRWTESHILDRGILQGSGPWEHTNRDTVLEQGYEVSGLPPQTCSPRYTDKKTIIISGVWESTVCHSRHLSFTGANQIYTRKIDGLFLSPMLDLPVLEDPVFRHNKDVVRDWTFLVKVLEECRITDPGLLSQGLKGPVKDSEIIKGPFKDSEDRWPPPQKQ